MRREVAVIEEYSEGLFEPPSNWSDYYFKCRSYSRWAAHEILTLIKRDVSRSPTEIVKEFADKMDVFSCYSDDRRLIFSAVRDTTNDILDIFRAMY